MAIEPIGEGRESRVAELGLQLAPDPRHMDEIAGLAIALQEAGEIAKDAGVALSARERIGRGEGAAVELGKRRQIAVHQGLAQGRRQIAPGIVDQGDEVEAAGSTDRILEIQPKNLHQRSPFFIGSKKMMKELEAAIAKSKK